MADELLNLNINPAQIGGAMQQFTSLILWIILGVLLVAVIFLIIYLLKFKHKAHIMDLTGSSIVHSYDRARIWRDKHNILWFKLLKNKYKSRVPEADAKGITNKGKFHFDLYHTEDKGYTFADQRSEVIKEKLDNIKNKEGELITNSEPFSTEDRTLLIIQQEESKLFLNFSWKKWLAENGALIVTGLTLVILIIVFTIAIDTLMPHLNTLSANRVSEAQSNEVLGNAINRLIDYMNTTTIVTPELVAPQ